MDTTAGADARSVEADTIARCVRAARNPGVDASDPREANVFRQAGMVLRSAWPAEAAHLGAAAQRFFDARPQDQLFAADVVRQGWVISLPRLRDMLERALQESGRPPSVVQPSAGR